jgi:hypothetical protein
MKNSLYCIAVVNILSLLLIGCGAPQTPPTAEAQPLPTLTVVAQPSVTPTVEAEVTMSPTARVKITAIPIPNTQTYRGESIELGSGTAQTWVRLDDAGSPLALGVQFTEEMLLGLPSSVKMLHLALPPEAAVTPFHHVMLNWNPRGHPPREYAAPHFDFHFYIIPAKEQMSIRGGYDQVRPEPVYIPAFYAPAESPSRVLPMMGAHWRDTKAPEVNGEEFTQTFFYGFLDGHLIFMEPMITKEFFETQPDVMYEIKRPEEFEMSGLYPTIYAIRYEADSGEYHVSLEDFVQH